MIDAHVHFTPPTLAANLATFSQQEPYWGLLLNSPQSIQGWATPARLVADMDAVGLDKVVLVGEYFQRHESSIQRNNQAIELIQQYPKRIIALATIQPKAGAKAIVELKRCLDNGLCGVGELNPYAQGYRLDDPGFLEIVELCIKYNVPLNLHVSEQIGSYYPGKSSTPLHHYYQLACRYPELKLILAHWGGGLFFYEMMPTVRQQLQNVWYDTAASPLLYPTETIFPVALNIIEPHKILYGSDYPLRLYPRTQKEPDFAPFIKEINELALPQSLYDDIMGRNTARLFGLCKPVKPKTISKAVSPILTLPINKTMPISLVAQHWPETQAVFADYQLAWEDTPVPAWEPINQAASVQGYDTNEQQKLVDALNKVATNKK